MRPQASLIKLNVKRRLYLRLRTKNQKKHILYENQGCRFQRQAKINLILKKGKVKLRLT